MIRRNYFCDCCNNKIENGEKFITLEVNTGCFTHKEDICKKCLETYTVKDLLDNLGYCVDDKLTIKFKKNFLERILNKVF